MLYIVELENTRTISQAAKNLNISQAGLSQSIGQLEKELGLKLFNRTRQGTTPTFEGKKIILQAKNVLNQVSLLKSEVKSLKSMGSPPLRIGVTNEIPRPFMSQLIKFQLDYPELKITINEDISKNIVTAVKKEQYDIGFIVINRDHYSVIQDLSFEHVSKGLFRMYLWHDHYLANYSDPIPIELIKEQEFVLFIDEYIDDFIDVFEKKYGLLNVILRTSAFKVLMDAMETIKAVSIIRDTQIQHSLHGISEDFIVSKSIQHIYDQPFQFGWIKHPSKQLTSIQNEFIQSITSAYKFQQ